MERELYDHLLELHNKRKVESPFVLPLMCAIYTGPFTQVLVGQFRHICDDAGLKEHSFHSFRHGFVSRLVNAGVDPITIGSMTGQTIEQIQEYSHVSPQAKVNALAQSRAALHQAKLEQMRAPLKTVQL